MLVFSKFKYFPNVLSNILSKTVQSQVKRNLVLNTFPTKKSNLLRIVPALNFHTSSQLNEIKGLYEFFDDKENWGVQEVKVGRSWKKEELRIKSNEDLHKLWYVLLKEKNMLLTMEAASKREYKLFPNPERIDKVEESMSNLEAVVRERNEAYMLLETGTTGERPTGEEVDSFGRRAIRKFSQHRVPDHMHSRVRNNPSLIHPVRTSFSRLLREKAIKENKREKSRRMRHVAKLFQRFPDIDIEALKAKYPDVNVDKVKGYRLARGNHNNNRG